MPRKPFKAVPLKVVRNPPRKKRRAGRWFGGRGFPWLMVAAPLAAFSVVFFYRGPLPAVALEPLHDAGADTLSARFDMCSGPVRINCVVDGDTFWFRGEKIRIADINTPEVSSPECPAEAALGRRATNRLLVLLNEGAFSLESGDRDRDRYDRLLRTVTRDGDSLGLVLVDEGLAEEWRGYRGGWC